MTVWQQRADWVGSQVEDRFVMINVESGVYVALNETAAEVWNMLADPRGENALVDALTAKYAIDRDACRQSVAGLLGQMVDQKLIERQQ